MMTDLKPGMNVWRFRLRRELARGGMGTVWAAWDERLDREVALKLLPRVLVTEPSAEARFEREALAMARLQHPNVVSIFDVGTFDPGVGEELPYLVMELVRGRSLNDMLADGPLPPRKVARIIEQASLALAAAHEVGVIHRDLKPSNLMISDGGHVTVLDFGLARLAQREGETPIETLTSPGMVLGSCPYMAPEQALGKGISPASDIFSCGSVLYEALSGARAFEGQTPLEVLQAVVRAEYRPLSEVAPRTPSELVAIVERCLAREPERRYRSNADLARDLAIFQGTDEASLAEAPTLAVNTSRLEAVSVRRRRLAMRGAGFVAAAAAVGIVIGALIARIGTEPKRPEPGRWVARSLLDAVGTLNEPDWSPSGDEIAIARNHGGRSEVMVVDVASGTSRNVLSGALGEGLGLPNYSPDGKALLVEAVAGGDSFLRVVPAVGGRPITEVTNAGGGSWLDSDTFLFSREDVADGFSLYRYSVSKNEAVKVRNAEPDHSWYRALLRPRGGFALLAGSGGKPESLFVSRELQTPARSWLALGELIYGADWAPSGRSLVASVDGQIFRVSKDGGTPIIPRVDRLWYPSLAPDGRSLAVVRRNTNNDLVAVDPDGRGWSCVLCGVSNSGWGSVDAAGSIVFRRYVSGNATIFLRQPSGHEAAITDPSEDASCPSVSPEGDRIAYLAQDSNDGTVLRVVSRIGGQPVTLATDVEASEYPSWSPDGRHLAFAAGSPTRIWVVSAAGGEPRELTPLGGDYPRWSPDGRWIAYSVWTRESDPDQGGWVVPAEGGTPQKVSDEPTRLVWSRSGGLLWQLRRNGDRIELWETASGEWDWSRRSTLDLGMPAASHLEHLPLTVDPRSGELIMNRRSTASTLVVFEGLDPDRW
jgi:serine/threonine protein kinase/Tol biopolymer transport system component